MNSDLERIVRELKDRQEIHDCLVRYCRGMDRLDRELLLSAYHPDALDDHGPFVGTVEGFWDYHHAYHTHYQTRTVHDLGNHTCEIDGDTAHCETYYTFTAVNTAKPFHNRTTGRYIDRLERRDGRWAIAARICTITGMDNLIDPDGLAGDAGFVASSRDGNDPSYSRPLNVDPARINNAKFVPL